MANYGSDSDEDVSMVSATATDSERSDADDDYEASEDNSDEAADSGDEYVDSEADEDLHRQYKQAQQQQPAPKPDPRAQKSPAERLTRRRAKAAVDYREKDIEDIPFQRTPAPGAIARGRLSSLESSSRPFVANKAKSNNLDTITWAKRAAEEAQTYSFANPFRPTSDDIACWISEKAPPHKDSWTVWREAQDAMTPSNGRNNIVEEYQSPFDSYVEDFEAFRGLNDAAKQEVIQREAEEFGLEKPKGYNVSFHYNPHVEYHHFGSSHPMKPWRLTLTKQLIVAYGLEYTMDLYEPRPASFEELAIFHDREYLSFIKHVTPHNMKPDDPNYLAFGFGGESNDCPVFDGLWNYVSLYSGASLAAAHNLINHQSNIAINWSGGLHHAKKNLASGFCYVNDIVLAIQHLLTGNQRVLYIDIDVHHGDGVEQAFESSDRVFTLSYHKYGIDKNGYPFFPGTGGLHETGSANSSNPGRRMSLNIPIEDGIDDDQYKWLFKTVTGAVIQKYNPEAIVLQSGADSLGGDRLGRFNLNIKAHGFCIETVKNYGRPLLLIGGGGYTPRNVARTWCHETAVCVGAPLHNDLPTHIPYIQAFQGDENGAGILYPDLHNTKRHDNANTATKLQKIVETAMEHLRFLECAPSVVVNTRGISEEMLMKVRESVERELDEEREDKHHLGVERARKNRERNVGGRGERR